MPQNISGAPIAQPSVQVDSYADRLMDDLFEDVEGLLSGSVPPPEPVRAQSSQKKPEFVMPPAISAIVATPALSLPSLPQWNTAAIPEMEELISAERIQPHNHRFQKFLAIAFGLTAMAAASVWLIQRGTVQRMFTVMTQEPAAIATSTTIKPQTQDANAQFAKYMQRSLNTLDLKVASKSTNVTPLKSGLPPVAVASNATLPKSSSPVVINVPSMPSSPPATTANSRSPQELNQVLTRLSSVLERLSINPSSNPIAVRPNVPAAPVILPSQAPTVAPASEAQRALRGIAIASDPTQSAILFEMNGVTQRYYIGESIGSSGWSVVDIANNYVTVRKNGEIRTLSIGQKL